jgi:hypothetical protein
MDAPTSVLTLAGLVQAVPGSLGRAGGVKGVRAARNVPG